MNTDVPFQADNQIYYFKIGKGKWEGQFHFRLIDHEKIQKG